MFGGQSGKLPSVMNHSFSQVPKAEIPRSTFNRSHGYKTTFNSGYLVPVFVDEALPGDTFAVKMSCFARLATPIVPFMDNLYCDSFFFAVPYRLVWDNFQKFMGEQIDPGDSTDFLIPQMESPASTGYAIGSLSDYFGLPTGIPNLYHNSLWHRAYNLIYNQWFRDQNLQDSVVVDKDDGPDDPADYVLLKRGKRHDYFTSCLPWPQKGPAVTLPLGTSAPVLGIGKATNVFGDANQSVLESGGSSSVTYPHAATIDAGAGDTTFYIQGTGATGIPDIRADLTQATAATINALRQAFQIQRLYERDARGGTRYTEILKSHFQVTSPDARLQRPEVLGTGSTPINISPVPQTSSTDNTSPQGNLAAMGTMSVSGHGFVKSFVEHCLLIGMVCVRADLNYQSGLDRMFTRRTRFDHYWPALSHIGEQAVLNQEIYCVDPAGGGDAQNNGVFGYQERFSEYRYKNSKITGKFRSQASGTLDIWHLAQKFTSLPVLGDTFIQEAPPINRVIAVTSEPELLFDAHFDMTCARPMPTYSVPGLIDHF